MAVPSAPRSPSLANTSRGTRPASSQDEKCGTTSLVTKSPTSSRNASWSSVKTSRRTSQSSAEQFDDGGVGGAAALAHRLQPVADPVVAHVVQHPGHQDCARSPERVPEGDRPTEGVEPRWVRAGLREPRERYRGECLVDLVDADVGDH